MTAATLPPPSPIALQGPTAAIERGGARHRAIPLNSQRVEGGRIDPPMDDAGRL